MIFLLIWVIAVITIIDFECLIKSPLNESLRIINFSIVLKSADVITATCTCTTSSIAVIELITLASSTQITVSKTANYNFQFSAQVDKTDTGLDQLDIWILRNNANYPDTNTTLTLNTANEPLLASWNYTLALTAGDFVEIGWQSADINIRLLSIVAQILPSRPSTPSVRCTIIQM
jgi:hypothetical protein